jgi:hypothetical protein
MVALGGPPQVTATLARSCKQTQAPHLSLSCSSAADDILLHALWHGRISRGFLLCSGKAAVAVAVGDDIAALVGGGEAGLLLRRQVQVQANLQWQQQKQQISCLARQAACQDSNTTLLPQQREPV